ncbi:MAG: DUF4031 domain-containing protein [Tetrasphaera sp.]|nr:DUF4031 domain-containing protein [Tetrasphaera sp.]
MALLIDPPAWGAHGRLWSHLISDTSLAELHDFAGALGIPRRAFEGDHYDIPEERYAAVLAAGAAPVPGRDLLAALSPLWTEVPETQGGQGDRAVDRVDSPVRGRSPTSTLWPRRARWTNAGSSPPWSSSAMPAAISWRFTRCAVTSGVRPAAGAKRGSQCGRTRFAK